MIGGLDTEIVVKEVDAWVMSRMRSGRMPGWLISWMPLYVVLTIVIDCVAAYCCLKYRDDEQECV